MRQFRRFSIAGGHCYPLLEGWGWGEAALPSQGMGHPEDPGNTVDLSPGSWNQGQNPATTRGVAREGRRNTCGFFPPTSGLSPEPPIGPTSQEPEGRGHQEQKHAEAPVILSRAEER